MLSGGIQYGVRKLLRKTRISPQIRKCANYTDAEEVSDLAIDAQGNAYVTGITHSPDFPTTAFSADTSYNGSADGRCKTTTASFGLYEMFRLR